MDLHLVLVHPEIPWNTGNTGRSCLAFGAQLHLVKPLGFSLDERQVRRAGLDYWNRVPLRVHEDLAQFEALLPELGDPWLLAPEGPLQLMELPLRRPAVFLLGSEASGLPPDLLERHPGRVVSIPQAPGSVRSLNQSTCAALALYEFRRRFPLRAH